MISMHRALALVLVSALASPALAGDAADGGGLGSYFEIDGHATYLSAPGVDGSPSLLVTGGGSSRRAKADSDVEGLGNGIDAMLGFGIPGGFLPEWQLELGASWTRMKEHATSADRLGNASILGGSPPTEVGIVIPIDGSAAGPLDDLEDLVQAFPGQTLNSEFDGRLELWDLRLQLAIPVDLPVAQETKLRLGLLGGVFDQDYRINQKTSGSTQFCCFSPIFQYATIHDVDELVESFFVGPVLGAAFRFEPVANIRFTLETEVALLYHRADLDAEQDFTILDVGVGDFENFHFDENDGEDHFTARPRIEGALEIDFGFVVVGLSASFSYWSYVPSVVNPRVPPRLSNGPLLDDVTSTESAHLSGGGMLVGEVGGKIVIPFGGS